MKPIAEMTQEEREHQMRICSLLLKDEGIGLKIMIALQGSEILQNIRKYQNWRFFTELTTEGDKT